MRLAPNLDIRPDSASLDVQERGESVRLRAVLHDCLRQRAAGVSISDEAVIASNPELMPRLGRELELMRILRDAAATARSGSGNGDSSGMSHAARRAAEAPLVRPDAIAGYRLVRELSRGGQGVVYVAEQISTHRLVAIKILNHGPLANPAHRHRFQREIEVLTRLRHPNIVTIHDTGVVAGLPYLVMDLIDGQPLDQHSRALAARGLSTKALTEARMRLFATICDAVHAAHLRGVIHRDLKPANILVVEGAEGSGGQGAKGNAGAAPSDPGPLDPLTPIPKILDFGLAKDVGDDSRSSVTGDGQFVGSVPWASPEQAACAAEIDVRTDVYSLGVILYHLLTDAFPYKVSGPVAEVFRAVTSEEPKRPSSIVRTLGREIDAIVLKCLSKERDRRYQSAGELASDIRRRLADEPVEAKRDSAIYVWSKQLRKHRGAAAGAVALVVGLAGFAVYAGVQARIQRELAESEAGARISAQEAQRRAEESERVAARERDEAQRARDAESEQRRLAESQAQRAEAVTSFLIDTLGFADPDVSEAPGATSKQLLDRAAAQISSRFGDHPESEASVRLVIGRAYAALGESDRARDHLERALDIHRGVLKSGPDRIYEILWPYAHVLSDESDTLASSRAVECERVGRQELAQTVPELAKRLGELSKLMSYDYSAEKAAPVFASTQALAAESFAEGDARWLLLADQYFFMGRALGWRRNPAPACGYLRAALETYRRVLPETNTRIVRAFGPLVGALIDAGLHDEAEALAREAIATASRTFSADHWYMAVCRSRLGGCLIGQGRTDEARGLLLEAHARLVGVRGPAGRHVSDALRHLIRLYVAVSDEENASLRRHELAASLVGSPEDASWLTSPSYVNSSDMAFGPELQPLVDALAEFRSATRGIGGDVDETATDVMRLRGQLLPGDDAVTALTAELTTNWVGTRKSDIRSTDAVVELMRENAAIARGSSYVYPRKAASMICRYGMELRNRRQYAASSSEIGDALAILESGYGTYAYTNWMQSQLAESLIAERKYEEAEAFALAGYDGLREYGTALSGDSRMAARTVLRLYERWKRHDEFSHFAVRDLRELQERPNTNPRELARSAWRVLKHADFSPAVYALAYDAAQRVAAGNVDATTKARVLGAAQYRVGRRAEAVETLVAGCVDSNCTDPFAWSMLALARRSVGQAEEAAAAYAEANMIHDAFRRPNDDVARLLSEFESGGGAAAP